MHLPDLLRQRPGYRLKLVGHSLGGGIASLIAHMAHTEPRVAALLLPPRLRGGPPGSAVSATAVASPCIMSGAIAEECGWVGHMMRGRPRQAPPASAPSARFHLVMLHTLQAVPNGQRI